MTAAYSVGPALVPHVPWRPSHPEPGGQSSSVLQLGAHAGGVARLHAISARPWHFPGSNVVPAPPSAHASWHTWLAGSHCAPGESAAQVASVTHFAVHIPRDGKCCGQKSRSVSRLQHDSPGAHPPSPLH